MKKRIISILLTFCLCLSLLPTVALAAGPDVWDGSTKAPSGSGSESDPYLISTGEELAWLATLAAEGSYYVQLTNDIILNDGTFDQSGNFTKTGETAASTPHAWTPAQKAVWHIDGGNHYISGLYINSNDNDDVGLFSNLRGGSYVKNLTIKNSYVTASQSDKFFGVGVFAGQSSSDFTNCAGENNIVSASRYATGGIVGYSNRGSFNGVHTSGSISGGKGLGGLVGWVFGDTVFKNCWNGASVSGGNASGGIVGSGGNYSDCYNCANLGSGGITGSTGRTIKNCYNLSEVESYGGADKLLTTLNDNLYEMGGVSDLNNWVMDACGYPLPKGSLFVDETVYYDVWLNGVRVSERNQNDILKNGLASYNKDTKTLYLHDGLVVTNPYNKRLLYTEGDINLCVDGSVEFRSAQKVGSGPIVIDLGEVGGSGNLKIYAPTGKSAAVTVTCEQSEYGIDVRSLTLDGDVSLTVRTKDTPCFANCNTITLLSSEAVLDAENGDEDGRSMLNSVSEVILPSTNPQKLYEGIGAELDCVEQFTTQDDNEYDCMYPHIRIAPEVYTLIDTLPKSLTVSMTEANTQTALSTWAAGEIRKGDITASNSEITVSDVVPAVAGSETNQSGTDGSFTVTVKLTKNGISKTTTIPGTITATAYTAPPHTHSWATEWSNDETYHWHECTAEGCGVTNNADKNGYAAHTYDQEIATADYKASNATCTAKATYYKSCICGAKGTETFESGEVNTSNHTFGDWIDEVPATCKATGTKGHRDCTSCGKHFDTSNNEITDLTIPVDPNNHEGAPGDWVKTDPDKHWKEYSCCHVKAEEGTHVYTDDADTDCNTCGYERTITPSHTHSWATAWSKNETHHWHECTADGCDVTDNAEKDSYAEHAYDQEIATDEYKASDATCTAKATYYKSCVCGAKSTETFESGEVNASNHTGTLSGWQTDSSSHWKEYPCCVAKADDVAHTFKWVIDKEATTAEKGSKHEECTVCGYKKAAVEIPATGSSTGETTPDETNPDTGATTHPATGDNSHMALWFALLFVSGAGVIGTTVYGKKKRAK